MFTWLTSMAGGLDRFGEVITRKNVNVFFGWFPFSLSTSSPNPISPFSSSVRQFGCFL